MADAVDVLTDRGEGRVELYREGEIVETGESDVVGHSKTSVPDCIECANGLVMMHGRKMVEEAGKLYAKAAAMKPRDAMEKLDVEMAKAELA